MTKKFITPEAEARHILEQCGVEDAEHYTAGDVVGLANLLVERDSMRARIAELEATLAAGLETPSYRSDGFTVSFDDDDLAVYLTTSTGSTTPPLKGPEES